MELHGVRRVLRESASGILGVVWEMLPRGEREMFLGWKGTFIKGSLGKCSRERIFEEGKVTEGREGNVTVSGYL
jgi:hypothetical protein